MRGFLILAIIYFLLTPNPSHALFQKKDYRQIFLNNAHNAEKRHNNKSAFHSYEKALYYYKKDKKVIVEYAKFCERQKYFDKAEELYKRAYTLTKDKTYLFSADLSSIKNGKVSDEQLKKIFKNETLTSTQRNELNQALIYHYSYKTDWANVKKTCDKIPKKDIGEDLITTCIVANERKGDKKSSLGYYLRFYEINPNNSETIDKIVSLAEDFDDYPLQEKFVKRLSALNPNDSGIKYHLAGVYEKHGEWKKAVKVYEGLMAGGDTSEHVKKSHAYALSQANPSAHKAPKDFIKYIPKPLSGFKLSEKLFYEAWETKDYEKAQMYLAQMLKVQPKNPKLLNHKIDIDVSQERYKDAISTFEELHKLKTPSAKEQELLAFLYSKTENYSKSLEIIEQLLQKKPKDKKLLKEALDYSMAEKNWDKAIVYTDKLLELEPNSENLLKQGGDLYSIKQDFSNAAKYYEVLVAKYPTVDYKLALANFYMAGKNFVQAQYVLECLYMTNPDNPKIIEAYLNSLLAQDKLCIAYDLIQKHNLQNTKEGYMVMGDLATLNKKYEAASSCYFKAYRLAPNDLAIENKLAHAYRMMGYLTGAASLYNGMLVQDPGNYDARLGLGSLEIDKKNFCRAREIFSSILCDKPDYRPAKIAMAHSYIANDEKMSALNILNQIPEDDESKLMKGQAYYDMSMWKESKQVLLGTATKDAQDLKYKIRRDNAITITPGYSFFFQQLADEFKLDYHKFGVQMAQKTKNNANVFMEYNVYVYSSGGINRLNNVTHEFRGGVQARPTKKWEYRADLGVKAFEYGEGAMLLTDSWIKHYFSDRFNLKLGIRRNNLEQSYLSAVGQPIDGVFTGRVADTKVYLSYEGKLPYQFYTYGMGSSGFMYAQNLPTNPYFELMFGAGKILYNNPKNKWLQTFAADLVTYNSSYQYDLLKIYNSAGKLFGGYFSPDYFNATTLNLKAEGEIKKWRLKYGVKGFGGIQTAISPDQTRPTWGFSPYIAYDINDNVTINAMYYHLNYADLKRDLFMINAVIRGFKNAKK